MKLVLSEWVEMADLARGGSILWTFFVDFGC